MYDHFGNYDLALRLAGVPPIVASFAMFAIRCVKRKQEMTIVTTTTTPETIHMNGKTVDTGRWLLEKGQMSICVLCDDLDYEHKRCYSYSIM